MNTDQTETSQPINARRRLVRGVFAAPLALPLQSHGFGVQNQSLTCVARQVNNAPLTSPALNDPSSVGSYVRVKLWKMGGVPADTASYWVSGADLTMLLKLGVTSYLLPTEWQAFKAEINSGFSAGQKLSSQPTPPSGVTPNLAVTAEEVAVRFDANGHIVGIIDIPYTGMGGTSAITGSCWSSFKP